ADCVIRRRGHFSYDRVQILLTAADLEVVAGYSAGQIHCATHIGEAATGNLHLRVDRHVVDVPSQAKRTRRGSTQAKTRRREATDSDERERMHPHIHIDPQQTPRSKSESTGA